jgi:hypothetical protein
MGFIVRLLDPEAAAQKRRSDVEGALVQPAVAAACVMMVLGSQGWLDESRSTVELATTPPPPPRGRPSRPAPPVGNSAAACAVVDVPDSHATSDRRHCSRSPSTCRVPLQASPAMLHDAAAMRLARSDLAAWRVARSARPAAVRLLACWSRTAKVTAGAEECLPLSFSP